MKPTIRSFCLASVLACLPLAAAAAPPSNASVETLLTLTKSEATLDAMYAQIEPVTTQSMRQAFAGQPLSASQQRAAEGAIKQALAIVRAELSWASMKLEVVKIYRETFSQEEVDGMIAYYRSPPGIAAVEKLPTVLQRSNAYVMSRMPAISAKVNAATQKALVDVKATK